MDENFNYERRKNLLQRTYFEDVSELSTVPELPESEDEALSAVIEYHGSPHNLSGSSSPLPDLIIEKEPNKHDEPEEFYQQLEIKVLKYCRKLFGKESESFNINIGQDITGVDTSGTSEDNVGDEEIENDNNLEENGNINSEIVDGILGKESIIFKVKRPKTSDEHLAIERQGKESQIVETNVGSEENADLGEEEVEMERNQDTIEQLDDQESPLQGSSLSSKGSDGNEVKRSYSCLEAVRCNEDSTSSYCLRHSLDERSCSPPRSTPDVDRPRFNLERISDINDIISNSAEAKDIEEITPGDFDGVLRASTPMRPDCGENCNSGDMSPCENDYPSRGVQTSPNKGTGSSSDDMSWNEVRNGLFVGSPIVYRLCSCRHHKCQ